MKRVTCELPPDYIFEDVNFIFCEHMFPTGAHIILSNIAVMNLSHAK